MDLTGEFETEKHRKELEARRAFDNHIIGDFDYSAEGGNRINPHDPFAFPTDTKPPHNIHHPLFFEDLDYTKSEILELEESTEPELDGDELRERLVELGESDDFVNFLHQMNLWTIRHGGTAQDLRDLKATFKNLKPHDADSRAVLSHLIKLIVPDKDKNGS